MKKMNLKLLVSALALGVAAISSVGSTYAWFSMNTTVQATGMSVSAAASGSLVISENTAPAATVTDVSIALTNPTGDDAKKAILKDCTHDTTYPTGLKTITAANRADVDHASGVYTTADTKGYVDAKNADPDYYYYDWTVVIASKNAAIAGQDIKATLGTATGTTFAHAVAVDFYETSVSADNYRGTAHANGTDAAVTVTATDGESIPQANGTAGIKIIMRVYIDGAYKEGTPEAILATTDKYDASAISFGVTFVSSNHA